MVEKKKVVKKKVVKKDKVKENAEGDVKEEVKEKVMKLGDLPGIGPAAVEKLENAGIFDLMGIAVLGPKELGELSGLGEPAARKAIQAARKMMDLGFQDGLEFAEKRKEVFNITTGSKEFDNLLGGKGIETKAISEGFGAFGSGKCVSKDTPLLCFDEGVKIEESESLYNKYKKINGERKFEEGFIVPVDLEVYGLVDDKFRKTKATFLYKEFVSKIYEIKTKRGRVLKISGPHKLLSFDKGLVWKSALGLANGDLISSPKTLNFESVKGVESIDEDDAYFLGLFVAEGTANPLSITTGNKTLALWLKGYIEKKFDYLVKIDERIRDVNPIYRILIRNCVREFLGELAFSNSSSKFVPKEIFLSSDEIIRSFLSGYFEGDAEVAKMNLEVSTKSRVLARDISYLLLRLGISCTRRKKIVDGKVFHMLFIVGEDREKLNQFPFKIKKADYDCLNSSWRYSGKILEYIKENYKITLGGNRGREEKFVGRKGNPNDIFYKYLVGKEGLNRNMNQKTMDKIIDVFREGLERVKRAKSLVEFVENKKKFLEIYHLLPFAFDSIAGEVGLEKSGVQNYASRGVASQKQLLVREILNKRLGEIEIQLINFLKVLGLVNQLNWDIIEEIKEIEYNDYVYDFVVPEGHSFIGGEVPTLMHNTQLGLTLAINVQLPVEKGGAEGKAVYIDTEGTFRPERIKQIAGEKSLNPEGVLKNILVARAFNSDHQMLLVDKIGELIKDGEAIRLVVIDSLTAHFRAEFSGRGQLADRQQKLNKYLHNLMRMAEQFNLAVYVTNQVMSNPAMMFGDPTTPIGGNIVGHASQFRFYIRKGKKGSRVAKLIDSPNLPDNECVFFITEKGICDEE